MNTVLAAVIIKENLDRLKECRAKAAIEANKRAYKDGERHHAADRAAEAYQHWVEELESVLEWVRGLPE